MCIPNLVGKWFWEVACFCLGEVGPKEGAETKTFVLLWLCPTTNMHTFLKAQFLL